MHRVLHVIETLFVWVLSTWLQYGWLESHAGRIPILDVSEQRYAPIEGEALAASWGLEQSKYFTQGFNDLLVVTDHKPLVKILGDRTFDDISNTRILRLKQRTLPWSFDIAHLPGKTNSATDAMSRHPSPANEFAELRRLSLHSEMDEAESTMAASLRHKYHDIIAISWERIATETASDPTMGLLLDTIQEGFPDDRRSANDDIAAFWKYRDSLNVTVTVLSYPCLAVTRSSESYIPHTREYRPWSHEPDLSYSGKAWPMKSGLSENNALPITGQHRHK